MAWTAPRTWVAGETVTAAIMNTHVRDNLKAIGDPWTSYTPTISGVTSSTVTARYVLAGKLLICRVQFTLTGTPSGTLSVSLPATCTTSWGVGQHATVGTVTGLRQGTGYRFGSAYQASATAVSFQSDSAGTPWAAGVPVAWANTDLMQFSVTLEAA